VAERAISLSNRIPAVNTDNLSMEDGLLTFGIAMLDGFLAPEHLNICRLIIAEFPQYPDIVTKYYEQAEKALDPLIDYIDRLA
ncbi:TetR/AcrR family transcriptional regulator C-terminal domain-containing protein, partial [Acinetobacter baumannii]